MSKAILEGIFVGKLCAFGDKYRKYKKRVLFQTWKIENQGM
jgi:hypothetical protein